MTLIKSTATQVARLAYEAQLDGVGSGTEANYSGDCTDPVYVYLAGLPDPVLAKLEIQQLGRVSQHLYVRCRRCPACLRQRARLWRARATCETLGSARTWFGTLTLAPDRATQARYHADRRLQERISSQSDTANQFGAMVDFVNPEITRWLKRVRKNTDAALRYLLVAEAHKSGIPHWHCLIHEYAGKAPKRALHTAWRYGFSHFKLVDIEDARAASYVCKYLAKSAITRIRASRNYGSVLPDHITERILSATRALNEGRSKHASPEEEPSVETERIGTLS